MILPYIINAALVLAACLVFYKLLLRRETFYKVNRYLLLFCLFISFALPWLQVPEHLSLRKKETTELNIAQQPPAATTPVVQEKTTPPNAAAVQPRPLENNLVEPAATSTGLTFSWLMKWVFWLYWFGVILFAASFLFQIGLLLWRSYHNPVIIDGKFRIVEVSGDKAPCSFGNTIFINPEKYEWETYSQILMHEKIHVGQKHTIDILLAELVLIFQWFNPFAWVYRREVENNLEFLTDDQLMQHNKVDKQRYQLSLVQVSAPQIPLSLTTNYNQSILKKRIAMMNTKRSNLHTAWKYFFLVPVFAFLASLLNEPVAKAQSSKSEKSNVKGETKHRDIGTEGYWFAIIKDDKVNIRFSDEKIDDKEFELSTHSSFNATTFKLSELGTIPKGSQGNFSISREAGKMEMTGKFDGNTGMGTYKFVADKAYVDYMNKELKETLDVNDQVAFFFINIRKDYLQMLQKEGFTNITKDDIIPMAAMHIDAAYIKSIKDAGFKDVDMEKLIPLKALNVDAAYIKEIRDAGYKNVTSDQLVTFKAQGIDKKYIESVREMKGEKGEKGDKGDKGGKDDDADDIVSFKAMNITAEYINSFKAVGYDKIPHGQLFEFKALGVTPEFIKTWQAAGFKNLDAEDLVAMKAQNVTPEYMKSFTDLGYKNIKFEELVSFRALGITPEFIKSFEAAGYKNIGFDEVPALKSLSITPEFIKSFEAVGFKNIDIDEIVSVKAVGVTPEYIKEMKAKGFNYEKIQKYVTLKTLD